MARHRHAVNVRADGLSAVLGPLGGDPAVLAALLVDIDSGMVLAATGHPTGADRETLGAVHGELMRLACDAASGLADLDGAAGLDTEVTVRRGLRRHLVVRRIADPYGDRLALSLLVEGPARALRRVRRRLGDVSGAALTAGPTVSLRPRDGAWVPGAVEARPVLRAPTRAPRPSVIEDPRPGAPLPALAVLDDGIRAPRPSAARMPIPGLVDDPRTELPGNTTLPMPSVAVPPVRPPAQPLREEDRPPAPPSALPPPGPAAG
jgi:hypothetical protein